ERSAFWIGRVLVGADDVRAGPGKRSRDRRNDAVPVAARDDQPRNIAHAEWSRPRNVFAQALVPASALSFTTTGLSSIDSSSPYALSRSYACDQMHSVS